MKQKVRLTEKELTGLIKESVKSMINEDFYDGVEKIDHLVKMIYKLRHEVHKTYDFWDYGLDFDDENIDNANKPILGKNGRLKGLMPPAGKFDDYENKIEKLLYDAYYYLTNLAKQIESQCQLMVDDAENDLTAQETDPNYYENKFKE